MRRGLSWKLVVQAVMLLNQLLVGHTANGAACELPWSPAQLADINALEQTVRSDGAFWRVDSTHFIVRTGVDAHFTAELSRYLELFTSTAESELELPPPCETEPADVTVYDTQAGYRRGIGSLASSRGQFDWFYAGLAASPCYSIQTYIARADERVFDHFCLPILNHEVTHFLLQCRAGRHRIPDAIHEGVATYMQAWDVFHDTEWNHTHRHSAFAAELKRSIAAATLPGFSSLLTATRWDIDNFGPRTNERYASAESFISFLHATPAHLPFFHALLLTAFVGGDTQSLVAHDGTALECRWRADLHLSPPVTGSAALAVAATGLEVSGAYGASSSSSQHRTENASR